MPKKELKQIAAIDVGSMTVKSIIGEIDTDGKINIIGIGKSNIEQGMKKGNIVSISPAKEAIKNSIQAAVTMSGAEVEEVVVSISGDHIKTFNSGAGVFINGGEIKQSDIDRVLQKSKDSFISQGKEVIHIIPQVYYVDKQKVKNPVDMTGSNLEAKVHVALANKSNAKNLVNCFNDNDIKVKSLVFAPIASSYGVLSDDERTLNMIVIDIGYGTSTAVAYADGSIVFSTILPVGGYNISNDLALTLNIDNELAEELKLKYGYPLLEEDEFDDYFEDEKFSDIKKSEVEQIIGERVIEIFELLKNELYESGLYSDYYKTILPGIVLTGGTANLKNIDILLKEVFGEEVKTRIGYPKHNIKELVDLVSKPEYATGVGLLHFTKQYMEIEKKKDSKNFLAKAIEAIKKRL